MANKNKKKIKQKPLKIRLKFNENISEEEEDKIWSQVFDILFTETDGDSKNENYKQTQSE